MGESLFHRYVVAGGSMMIFLIPCLFLAVAYAVQGTLNLRRRRVAPRDFVDRVRAAHANEGVAAARRVVEEGDHSLAEVLRNVLYHLEMKPEADPAEVLYEQIQGECDVLMQQNSQLSAIYRVSPLLGLLGTVFGMINTFGRFAEATNPSVQELSIGINIALLTTAWGLSIAIPAYVVLYLFQRRVTVYEQVVLAKEGEAALRLLLHAHKPSEPPRLAEA